jgi:Ca2+-binding EF-hand superfamily protein
MKTLLPVILGLALVLSACADRRDRGPRETDPDFHPTIDLLTKYDANHDGTITRVEMEAGLKQEFDAADTNHDGKLDPDEVAAVNAQRWNEDKSTASTIVDWNQDGFVDFNEFSGTARSLFADIDRDGDGQLTPAELQSYRGHKKPSAQDQDRDQPHGHRYGSSGSEN